MNQLITINGVRGYIDENGTAQLNLDDIARGLGFTQIKGEVAYVRWETVTRYLIEFGFSQPVGKDSFIAENIFYLLSMKASNDTAISFQMNVANEILPSIRKHGAYMTPAKIEEVLSDPDTIIRLATQLKVERDAKRQLEEDNARKQRELDYKGDVIIGLVDNIDLMEKRQTLNRIMRKPGKQYENRWNELYYQFEKKYHLDLEYQFEKYNKTHKPKLKGKIDFVDRVMGKLPELYELACKLYVNDVDKLVGELYGLTN